MSQMWIDTSEYLCKKFDPRQRTEGKVPLTLQHIKERDSPFEPL